MRATATARSVKLAEKILETAIDSGLHSGDRLAETALATACDVSRTPIRNALKVLHERGIARKVPEGGYVLAQDPGVASLLNQSDSKGINEELLERIVRDRASRRLGTAVTISDLVRRYDVTRSAAQNALEALQADGMIRKADGQSWLFLRVPGDRAAQTESYAFRLILEPQAILSDGYHIDPHRAGAVRFQSEGLLVRDTNAIAPADFQTADLAFHHLIARSCQNQYVSDALVAHHRLRHLPGAPFGISDFRIRQALEEHLRILDSIEQDQCAVAADLMRVHLRVSNNCRPSIANRGAPASVLANQRRR